MGVKLTITNNQQIDSATFTDTLTGTLLTGVVADSLTLDGTVTPFAYDSGTKVLTFNSGTLAPGTHYVYYTATVDKQIFARAPGSTQAQTKKHRPNGVRQRYADRNPVQRSLSELGMEQGLNQETRRMGHQCQHRDRYHHMDGHLQQ